MLVYLYYYLILCNVLEVFSVKLFSQELDVVHLQFIRSNCIIKKNKVIFLNARQLSFFFG